MTIIREKNGNLSMTAGKSERWQIPYLRKNATSEIAAESQFISEYLHNPMGDGVSYTQIAPEEVGALTAAPIISDGENIWGFMRYAVDNFLEELAAGRTVTWQRGQATNQ